MEDDDGQKEVLEAAQAQAGKSQAEEESGAEDKEEIATEACAAASTCPAHLARGVDRSARPPPRADSPFLFTPLFPPRSFA
jgi:hypothetical protein